MSTKLGRDRSLGAYTHIKGLLLIGVSTVVSGAITYLALRSTISKTGPFGLWNPVCFEFLGWWWVYYFLSTLELTKLYTLRRFLDGISFLRTAPSTAGERSADSRDEHHLKAEQEMIMREKAKSSRDVQGIMMAVVALLLTMVVVSPPLTPNGEAPPTWVKSYQQMLLTPLFVLATLSIVCWIISIDIFDTIMNSFGGPIADKKDVGKFFYREMAPMGLGGRKLRVSGAVSYGYLGFGVMNVFVLMCFSYFVPALAGYGTALYAYLAYPYFFGYFAPHGGNGQDLRIEHSQAVRNLASAHPDADRKEVVYVDVSTRWPSLLVGSVFVVGTVVTQAWN